MSKIPVVFLTDNNYCIPTSVAIQSMLDNSNAATTFDIFIIANDVSEDYAKKLRTFQSKKATIHLIDMNKVGLDNYNENGYYVSSTALLKFSIADLIPQYDKVLYIDGDILVMKDLSEFYNIDISKYYVAAIPDMAAIDACHFDEHLNIRYYMNSGVMLLNTKRMRKDNLSKKLYEVKSQHPEYMCMDQDVFNHVFNENILFLPPKFNLMFYNFIIAKFKLDRVNEFYDTDYSSFEEMEKDAVIIHLTNEKKPWKYKDAYKYEEWNSYYVKTAFGKDTSIVLFEENQIVNNVITVSKGPFKKVWTPEVTTLSFLNIPLVKKWRLGNKVKFKALGITLAKKVMDGFTTKYYVFGIRYKKLYDFNYYVHRINVFAEIVGVGIHNVASKEPVVINGMQNSIYGNQSDLLQLYKQFTRLDQMKQDYESKKQGA